MRKCECGCEHPIIEEASAMVIVGDGRQQVMVAEVVVRFDRLMVSPEKADDAVTAAKTIIADSLVLSLQERVDH